MANDTLTIALNGDVLLNEFSGAIEHFNALIQGLSLEVAGDTHIEWVVDSLESGSAIATVRGISDKIEAVASVVVAYTEVGKALQLDKPIPYSERVSKPAKSITRILNGKITSIRFETPIEDVMISGHYLGSGEQGKLPVYSFGTIKGTVQTLSRRRGVRFTVYDAIFDRAISCYLKEGQEDEIKDYWGKTVLVSGLVGRDGETGKPFAIRDISQIRLVESSAPGSYKLARGILQLKEGETPESVIRAVRNG